MSSAPLSFTATQKVVVGHDTEERTCPESIEVGVQLVPPLLVSHAFPEVSTATQKVVVGHDTEERVIPRAIKDDVQLVPPLLVTNSIPLLSTATQKVVVGHETEFIIWVESILLAADQLEPL